MIKLSEEQNDKFVILRREIIPENLLGGNIFVIDTGDSDIYSSLYKYDNENLIFVFSRLHFSINKWIKEYSYRFNKGNRYICALDRGDLTHFNNIIRQFTLFFDKLGLVFSVVLDYRKLISEGREIILKAENSTVGENFVLLELIIDEPIFLLKDGKKRFEDVSFLIFGAALTKPDIIIKDVLDGNLQVLNDKKVIVYDEEIKESITYAEFDVWWNKTGNKYSWYNPKEQMNELEFKVQDYYRKKYRKANYPVLIPQVYLHYDPKDKKIRERFKYSEPLTFQRMDFLMLYKNNRVIIEIDGITHTQEADIKRYSKQLEYDRTMKFLGYDVFRLGGYELTHNFDKTVDEFFENLMLYLRVDSN